MWVWCDCFYYYLSFDICLSLVFMADECPLFAAIKTNLSRLNYLSFLALVSPLMFMSILLITPLIRHVASSLFDYFPLVPFRSSSAWNTRTQPFRRKLPRWKENFAITRWPSSATSLSAVTTMPRADLPQQPKQPTVKPACLEALLRPQPPLELLTPLSPPP